MIFNIALFEFRRLFISPIAWLILAVTQFFLSLIFYNLLSTYLDQPAVFEGQGLTEIVVAGYYQISGIVFILITPFLTMRLISEDIRSGTVRLLFSSPISASNLILGKYLAVTLFMFCQLFLITLIPASLMVGTTLDYGHFISCVLGLILLIFALSAIGLFISALFQHPAIAAVATFALLFLIWTIQAAGNNSSESFFYFFNYLSLSLHFRSFTEGIFNFADFGYFIIIIIEFILLSIWRIDMMRSHHW